MQTANKIVYRTAVDIAMEEIAGRPRFEYFSGIQHPLPAEGVTDAYFTGPEIVFTLQSDGSWKPKTSSRSRYKEKLVYGPYLEQSVRDRVRATGWVASP